VSLNNQDSLSFVAGFPMAKEMVDGAWRKDSVPSPFPLLIKETQELSEEETNPDEQSIGHLSANV